ncbi:MAG: adenylate/guanylate cyclase domain-containing protein [Candidatus Rifleibacteriota bacterium]
MQNLRQKIETPGISIRNAFFFWLLVVAVPLLAGRLIFAIYLKNDLTSLFSRKAVVLQKDLENFERFSKIEAFLEAKIHLIESRLGFYEKISTEFTEVLHSTASPTKMISEEDFPAEFNRSFKHHVGLEPLIMFTESDFGKKTGRFASAAGNDFVGYLGNAAMRIIMKNLREMAESPGKSSRPAIFWQVFQSLAGSDFAKALNNRRLNSTFSVKLGGHRLFVYFNFFSRNSSDASGLTGFFCAFLEEQVDLRLHAAWAREFRRPAKIRRGAVVRPASFNMLDSISQGWLRVFQPVPMQVLRVGSHGGNSVIQRNIRNGLLLRRPAPCFFLSSATDLSGEIMAGRMNLSVYSITALILAFLSAFALKIVCFEGRIAFRIRTKFLLALFAAAILPMLLFYLLAGQYFDFYQKLLISNTREAMKQHLQMLELNIRNNEQQRNSELEKLKDQINQAAGGAEEKIKQLLETGMGTLYQGYFLVRSDGLVVERIPAADLLTDLDQQRLKMINNLFKSQCFRIFKDAGILAGPYYDEFRRKPAGRQVLGMGEFFSTIDLDNFCLQDGQYFQTEKAEKGIFQFITFNLLPGSQRVDKKWAFVGFMQNLSHTTSDYLSRHPDNWKFFSGRENGLLLNTVIFQADQDRNGRFSLGRSWPDRLTRDPGFADAARRLDRNNQESSWVEWKEVPEIFAARKIAKVPFLAVCKANFSGTGQFSLTVMLLFLLLYFLLLIIIISYAVADVFLNPLQKLLAATSLINAGEYRQIDYRSNLELAKVIGRFNQMTEGLIERQRLERFVSSEATRTIEREIEQQREHNGERLSAAILFSHVQGFDELCDNLAPEQLIELLNLFFGQMEPIIQANHGVIDKYIGDAIMVVFSGGTGADEAAICIDACRAGQQMQLAMIELNRKLGESSLPQINIGIGIAWGEVIRGKIGSKSGRKDFTVIGDVVNLAARLESLARKASQIMVSDQIFIRCRGELKIIPAGDTAIKGKSGKQQIYRLQESGNG